MSIKHLGETFDIHGGGADLIFPHHENEIAQSEAYTGKPFVRYWMHNGFITISKEKMSKSLGNFFTIRDILRQFDPEVVRTFLLSTHYRSPIEFSQEQLLDTEVSIDRFYSTILRIESYIMRMSSKKKQASEDDSFSGSIQGFLPRFEEAMDDDFNTALALGHMFDLIKDINRYLDTKPSGEKARELLGSSVDVLKEAGKVLNIFQRTPVEWHISLLKTKGIPLSEEEIRQKILQRQDARKEKNWELSDRIRDELSGHGIVLEDTLNGTAWRVNLRELSSLDGPLKDS